ncbi:ECSIT protein, partial [Alopecoenas beccarii]|nr:ECSIT protein [Alopecoenas beccarii]
DAPAVQEGPVFALCMAGAGDRHTLGRWIAGLQQNNPVLGQTPVVFRLGDGDPPGTPSGLQLRAGPPPP